MALYKQTFKNAAGSVSDLPATIHADASEEELKAFATSQGYDPSKWSGHKECLSNIFVNVGYRKLAENSIIAKKPSETIDLRPIFALRQSSPGIFPMSYDAFVEQVDSGQIHLLLDGNNRVVATIGVAEKLIPEIKTVLGIKLDDPTDPRVCETRAGLIVEKLRGLGVYGKWRRRILDEASLKGRLLGSQALGVGATGPNIRDGWSLIRPRDFPFAMCLFSWQAYGPDGELDAPEHRRIVTGAVLELPKNGVCNDDTVHFKKVRFGSLPAKEQERYRREEWVDCDVKSSDMVYLPDTQIFLRDGHNWDASFHVMFNDFEKLMRFEVRLMLELQVIRERDVVDVNGRSLITEGMDPQGNRTISFDSLTLEDMRGIQKRVWADPKTRGVMSHVLHNQWRPACFEALCSDPEVLAAYKKARNGGGAGGGFGVDIGDPRVAVTGNGNGVPNPPGNG